MSVVTVYNNNYISINDSEKDFHFIVELNSVMFILPYYYSFLDKISDIPQIKNATGFGLYDKVVLDQVRKINDPYPYFRGLVLELGYPVETIEFKQPRRHKGLSKNNFYILFFIPFYFFT